MTQVRQVFKRLDPAKLRVHPVSQQIYQDAPNQEMLDSVATAGVVTPLTVAADERTIVSGRRRRAAAITAKLKEVPCIVDMGLVDEWEIRLAILEANIHHPKTPEQKTREYAERLQIQQAQAAKRKASGAPAAPGEAGRAKEAAAKAAGMSVTTADKALNVLTKADELVRAGKTEEAEELVETLNEQGVSAAHRLAGDRHEEPAEDVGQHDPFLAGAASGPAKPSAVQGGKAKVDAKAISKSRDALASLARALPRPIYNEVKQYLKIIQTKLDAY